MNVLVWHMPEIIQISENYAIIMGRVQEPKWQTLANTLCYYSQCICITIR